MTRRPLGTMLCLALAAALAACGGGGGTSEHPDSPQAGPPMLGAGRLVIQQRSAPTTIEDGLEDELPHVGVSADWILSVTKPDNLLHAIDRRTGRQAWQARVPLQSRNHTGTCMPPMLASVSVVAVFVGDGCGLLVTYDLRSGRRLAARHFTVPGLPVWTRVVGVVDLDGRIWWATFDALGYLDDEGRPVQVRTMAQLGVRPDGSEQHITSLTDVTAGHELIVGVLSSPDHGPQTTEWFGLTMGSGDVGHVSAGPPRPTVRWRLSDRGTAADRRTLGLPDYAPGTSIAVRDDRPGGVILAGASGDRIAIGVPDPVTGHLLHPAYVPASPLPSVADLDSPFETEAVVDGGRLYTAVQLAHDAKADIEAVDLRTGHLLWRTRLPQPHGQGSGETLDYARSLGIGSDGSLYVVSTDGYTTADLVRFDADSGKVGERWALPAEVVGGYRIQVIDDHVFATAEGDLHQQPATIEMGAEVPKPVAVPSGPAIGPAWSTPSLRLRLVQGYRWSAAPPLRRRGVALDVTSGVDRHGQDLDVTVTSVGSGGRSLAQERQQDLVAERRSWGRVETRPDRRIAGEPAYELLAQDPRTKGTSGVAHLYGVVRHGTSISIEIDVPDDSAASRALAESILATITWR